MQFVKYHDDFPLPFVIDFDVLIRSRGCQQITIILPIYP